MALEKYLRTTTQQKITALIYGPPASGKTWGAMTFPNPHFVDLDNNLPAGIPNVIPIWDDALINSITPPYIHTNAKGARIELPDRRSALLIILTDLARELPAGSTVIVDSLTRLENYYNLQESIEPQPRSSRTGEVDGHTLFRKRLDYFGTLFTLFASAKAHIVFLAHQQQERDDKGNAISQLKPALMGQMGEKAPGFFSTVMQAVRRTKGDTVEYLWRVRPGVWEPSRIPGGAKVDFIPQRYSALTEQLGTGPALSSPAVQQQQSKTT